MSRVLVVDDDPDIGLLLRTVLEAARHDVQCARTGPGALTMLGSEPPPDVIVLDIQMPDMDGWEVLRRIRADHATTGVPVLLCSVKGSSVDLLRGWRMGCDGYLTKPFDIAELSAQVGTLSELTAAERDQRRRRAIADAQRMMSA